ncbi:MAG: sporulation initiation factor Spo0A C-terminal domain-containing protein [Firmicutes bacterium]|nr:sporulation initiation factor Spo0A C-terminal domain-containing protein [Bacillota bacterium]
MSSDAIKKAVFKVFADSDCRVTFLGFRIVRDCVITYLEEGMMITNMQILFLELMLKYKISCQCFERNMRTFISSEWKQFPQFSSRPSNWEFINKISLHILNGYS